MRVFVCTTCQTQHDYSIVEATLLCDECKQILDFGYPCELCNEDGNYQDEPEYHKTCLVKTSGGLFCKVHAVKKQKQKEAATIINKYAKQFWGELGGKISTITQEDKHRVFEVDIAGLRLGVLMTVAGKTGEELESGGDESAETITALIYSVRGIKDDGRTKFVARIHNHQDALEAVAAAILRSLRSKKSALTIEKKAIWEFATRKEKKTFNLKRKGIIEAAAFMKKKLGDIEKSNTKQEQEVTV